MYTASVENGLDKRRDVLLLKETRELYRKQKSATIIQLHYRCFAARKVLQRMRKFYTSEGFLMKRRSVFRAIAITKLQSFGLIDTSQNKVVHYDENEGSYTERDINTKVNQR